MLNVQAIHQDGSIALKFMADDPAEAEEMRQQMLELAGVDEVRVTDVTGWEKV